MTANPLTLVYDPVCPFAQRAWLALLEKEIPFAKLKVNHRKKEKIFTDIYSEAVGRDPSSKGKVPIIMHANKIIAESDLICWYLQEQFPNAPSLAPKDSFSRLKLRHFLQNIAPKFVYAFYSTSQFQTKSKDIQNKIVRNITNVLQLMENTIEGPYVFGEYISLADIFVYPWLERWQAVKVAFGIEIPQKYVKIWQLKTSMQNRKSVQATKMQTSTQFFIQKYVPYLRSSQLRSKL